VTGLFKSTPVDRNTRVNADMPVEILLPFNTMTKITIFLIFGLEMNQARMLESFPEGIVIVLGMMLITWPLSMLAFQWLFPFSLKESLVISWYVLRAAVPLALSFTVVDAIPYGRGIDAAPWPAGSIWEEPTSRLLQPARAELRPPLNFSHARADRGGAGGR
jgi:cell volume regulation protein A